MNVHHLVKAAAVLLASLAVSSCITMVNLDSTTRGRKLMDLENSRRSGSLSEAGYQKQRAEILAPSPR